MSDFRWDGPVPGVVASLVVTVVVALGEIVEGPVLQWLGLLAAVPLLAASLTPPLATALVSLFVTLTATAVGYVQVDAYGTDASDTGTQLARLAFIAVASVVFVYAAYRLGPVCFALSPVALVIVFWYSLAKRFTTYTQLFLGLAMAVAPVGGWLGAGGRGGWEPWLLGLAIGSWVGGFDVLYACQDLAFDR